MPYSEWQPGVRLPSPVYLDASVLVASFITNDPRYKETTRLFGDLLVSQAQIFISILTVSESLWGLAKVSYHQLFGHKSNVQFKPHIFRNHVEAIFQKYGDRMNAIHDWLREWRAAGIRIDVLPTDDTSLERISAIAPVYMQTFHLASADAVHLATAETGAAASLLTTDTEFERAQGSPLQIFRVTGASTTMV
jgi:predicted nucleic acid-binding protein